MCGIAGVVNTDGALVAPELLRAMTDALAHRGPDGEGFHLDGPAGLGHRRLAIIDLTPEGRQPMISADGRYALTYNGEIYNFAELRRELESLGIRFHSRTDSEVVVNAFAAWGPACLSRFNGMFALGIWDRLEKRLFLARDRYGIKPLYYGWRRGSFRFASEQKGILADRQWNRQVDLEALLEYFTFQNIFTDRTLLQGIRLLPPGHWATVDVNGPAELRPVRYWDYHFAEPSSPLTGDEYAEELERLIRQAVRRQLVSDVELGCYLSGGMDSGSITALAAGELPYIKTFTCGFDLSSVSGLEIAFDERARSERMSYLFRTEHYEMVLKSGDMERVLPRFAWHLEEPRVGQSYPNYYAAGLAGKFVKVVLSGAGGDELFGGYPWRYYRAVVNDDFEHYVDKYYAYWQRLIPNTTLHKVFAPVWEQVRHVWTRDIFRNVFADHAPSLTTPEDYVNHSLYFEAKTFLHGLLVVEDKLSMAHGLETRVPFLDNDLVDFAMQVPVACKLGNLGAVVHLNENEPGNKTARYFQKARDGKLVLRKAMARLVPDEIVNAEKQGFSAPDASWFKGESIDYVRQTLLAGGARLYDFLDRKAVEPLIEEHMSGAQNRRLLIWSLLNFEWWCRVFLDQRSPA